MPPKKRLAESNKKSRPEKRQKLQPEKRIPLLVDFSNQNPLYNSPEYCYSHNITQKNERVWLSLVITRGSRIIRKELPLQTTPLCFSEQEVLEYVATFHNEALDLTRQELAKSVAVAFKDILYLTDSDLKRTWFTQACKLLDYSYFSDLVAKRKINKEHLKKLTADQIAILTHPNVARLITYGFFTWQEACESRSDLPAVLSQPFIYDLLFKNIISFTLINKFTPSHLMLLDVPLYQNKVLDKTLPIDDLLIFNKQQCDFLVDEVVIALVNDGIINPFDALEVGDEGLAYLLNHSYILPWLENGLMALADFFDLSNENLYKIFANVFATRLGFLFSGTRFSLENSRDSLDRIIEEMGDRVPLDSYELFEMHQVMAEVFIKKITNTLINFQREANSKSTYKVLLNKIEEIKTTPGKNRIEDLYDFIKLAKQFKTIDSPLILNSRYKNIRFKQASSIQDLCNNLTNMQPFVDLLLKHADEFQDVKKHNVSII